MKLLAMLLALGTMLVPASARAIDITFSYPVQAVGQTGLSVNPVGHGWTGIGLGAAGAMLVSVAIPIHDAVQSEGSSKPMLHFAVVLQVE